MSSRLESWSGPRTGRGAPAHAGGPAGWHPPPRRRRAEWDIASPPAARGGARSGPRTILYPLSLPSRPARCPTLNPTYVKGRQIGIKKNRAGVKNSSRRPRNRRRSCRIPDWERIGVRGSAPVGPRRRSRACLGSMRSHPWERCRRVAPDADHRTPAPACCRARPGPSPPKVKDPRDNPWFPRQRSRTILGGKTQ